MVRRGVVEKVSQLQRDNSLAAYPTACPARRGLDGLILRGIPAFVKQPRVRVIPSFYPMLLGPSLLGPERRAGAMRKNFLNSFVSFRKPLSFKAGEWAWNQLPTNPVQGVRFSLRPLNLAGKREPAVGDNSSRG